MPSHIQTARRARNGIEQIRQRLLFPTPESVSACAAPLHDAIGCMELLQNELGKQSGGRAAAPRELRAEIVRLRTELSQVNALLRSAADFHEGYARVLRSHQQDELGYSRSGTTVRLPDALRLVVHG